MKTAFENSTNEWSKYYQDILTDVVLDKDIGLMIMHENRDELYNLMFTFFTDMQTEEPSLKTMNFYLADNTVFLRMQDRYRFLDVIDDRHPLIEFVNSTKKGTYGYNSCSFGGVFRIVTPIFYNDNYIGALEVGFDPALLAKSLDKSSYNHNFQYLMHVNAVEDLVDKSSVRKINQTFSTNRFETIFTAGLLEQFMRNNDSFNEKIITTDEEMYLIVKLAIISDYKKNILGVIVGAEDFSIEKEKYDSNNMYIYLISATVLFISMILVLFPYLHIKIDDDIS